MYDNPVYPVSGGIVSANKAAEAADNSEAKNFRDQIDKHLRHGKPLPKKLKAKLLASVAPLHEEVPLHTYTTRLFSTVTTLREAEERARARFEELDETATVEDVRAAFEAACLETVGVFLDTINKAVEIADADDILTDEDRTTVYVAARTLHLALIIWEESAKAMLKLAVEVSEDQVLDFVDLDGNVIDIAERAFDLYSLVEMELHGMRRKSVEDQMMLAEHDLGIVNLNMASISSHALDWTKSEDGYLMISGVAKDEAIERLSRLTGFSHQTLKQAAALMQRHERHVLIARNVAYMALQHDAAAVLREAADQLAVQHDAEPAEVWAIRIADREPLASEEDIADKFQGGQPIILKEEEAA